LLHINAIVLVQLILGFSCLDKKKIRKQELHKNKFDSQNNNKRERVEKLQRELYIGC